MGQANDSNSGSLLTDVALSAPVLGPALVGAASLLGGGSDDSQQSGGVFLQSTPDQLQQALKAAAKNGVPASTIQGLYNSGADPVQLMLAATNAQLSAPSVIQSQLDTINTAVGASNYAGQPGVPAVSAGGSSSNPNWWAANWTWAVPAAIAAIAGAYVIGRVL